ncbi:MAG: EAL domain-containing protein [Pseudomonadales bacterium]
MFFLNRKLRDLPIRKKLTLFGVITSLVSLIVAMAAIISYDRYSFKYILKDELVILASVISNGSSAAVVFDDLELATNNLKPLKFQDSIVAACIYKVEDDLTRSNVSMRMASYPNPNIHCPIYTPAETFFIRSSDNLYIELVQPIILDNDIVGYLYLKSNTSRLQKRQASYIIVILLVSVFAFIIAFWLASFFGGWISGPLLSLGKTAQIIAHYDDYSIRAQKYHNDEVGQVVDSFNQMLTVIEEEDVNLRESEEKFRLISASSKVGIFQMNVEGKCVYANEELSTITELANTELLSGNWLTVVHPADKKMVQLKWDSMLIDNQAINISCRLQNSETKWISGHVSLLKKADNQLIGYLGTINDITEVKNAQVQLEQMAFYDTLTGLANRRLFRNRLEYVINNLSRENNSLGLILLDLDHFKNINDSLGHDSGDSLLTIVAERLQLCVRASDTVARLGGDEFAVILPGINTSLAVSHIAQKILDTLKTPIILKETEIRLTTSAGITMAPDDSVNAETLVKNADLALYRAKDQGRDNYQFFTTEMNTKLINHLNLIEDLRHAIHREEFNLVFQPQIDISKGNLVGVEALIRWSHKTRGFVSPMEFIPAAEETGLIIPLGRWVINAACFQLKALCDAKLLDDKAVMAVNLSVKQFQDEELVEFIYSKLQEFDIKPSRFEIEITETVLMENLDEALTKLEALKNLGILISIDDFGTGYSSLGYLKRLPVNIVKVDRSFVMDIPQDKDDMEITAAIIAMAHSLRYEVIAEGIETVEQLKFLEECGCNYGQGYFFSKPLAPAQLEEFCKNYSVENHRKLLST